MIDNSNESVVVKDPEMLGGCCVCSDEEGWADNSLVYCDGDGCAVAVHQACYGILRVPEGNWYCRRCEAVRAEKAVAADVRCELCHRKDGALKATDDKKWCHVLCALYIPEATFGDVQAMEPIILRNVQRDRFGRACSLCNGTQGACTQCNCGPATNIAVQGKTATSCSVSFHVSCAQLRGMLCELQIGGTTRYPAFCEEHLKTLKPGLKLKRLPPYKGIPSAPSQPAGPPALRSRRKDGAPAEKSTTDPSPPSSGDANAANSVPQEAAASTSHVQSETVRHSSSTDSAEKERKKEKLKKRHAESESGHGDKAALSSSKSSLSEKQKSDEKKSRGRQKGSTNKKSDAKDSPAPPVATSCGSGVVLYGQLSQEAAIRVRHASGKDAVVKQQPVEKDSAAPTTTEEPSSTAQPSSSGVDLWSVFSQKKAAQSDPAIVASVLAKPEHNSLEELLDETFWKETGRFLLSEIQQSAPADIVELLHALYQVELENQQLEAKVAAMSSAIDTQKLTASRLAVPLSTNLSHFQTSGQPAGAPTLSAPLPPPQSQHQAPPMPQQPAMPSVIPFMFPHMANGVSPMPQQHPGPSPGAPYPMKGGPPNQPSGAAPMNAVAGPKQLPPAIPSPYVMPTDMAAMQQMQFQLYQHIYQQQMQHHLQPPTSAGQPMPPQPKLEVGAPFVGAPLPMSPPMMLPQPQQQQQRSLPLKLVEPAPTAAPNLLSVGCSATTAPPEGVLVPPPPLLSAPMVVPPAQPSASSPAVKKSDQKAQSESTNG